MKGNLILKKFVSITLTLSILMSTFLFTPTAFATETVDVSENNIIMNSDFYKKYGQAVERIAEGISNYQSKINISDLKVPKADKKILLETVLCTHPELFYVENYDGTSEGEQYINNVRFSYCETTQTFEDLDKKRYNFEEAANEYVKKIDTLPNNQMLRALTLHDELGLQVKSVSNEQLKNGIYNTMIEGVGNSYGYACVYAYLLSKLGIKNEIVKSGKEYWNKVCYNGKYYNVDVFGDSWYKTSKITHKRFFISDEKMTELTGCNFTSYTESATTYDNHSFHETDSRICYYKKNWYMIRNDYLGTNTRSLIKYHLSNDSEEIIRTFPEKWEHSEKTVWRSAYSGLDIYNGVLYFNTPDEIRTYDLRDNTENLFSVNIYSDEFFCVTVEDGKVYATTAYGNDTAKKTLRYIGKWDGSVKYIHLFDDFTERYGDVVDKVATAIKNYETSIDISEYKIPTTFQEDIDSPYNTTADTKSYTENFDARFRDILYNSYPELCFIEKSKGTPLRVPITFSSDENNEFYTDVNIQYYYSEAEMNEMRQKFEEKAEWYIKDIDSSWSDFQKMTFIHDRVCQNIIYLPAAELNSRIYQTMVENTGNCVGYSEVFSYLLSKVGIHSEIVGTNGHQLNKVYVDGEWYVVDPTWNDHKSDGKIWKNYFMISDQTRENLLKDKPENYFFYTCFDSSTNYENNILRTKSDTPICFIDNDFYTINSGADGDYARSLIKYNPTNDTNEPEIIKTFTERWGGRNSVYSGLAEYNGFLYYNSLNYIYCYDTKTQKENVFYTNNFENPFVCLRIHDGILYAETANTKDLSQRKLEYIGECIGRNEIEPVDKNKPLEIKNVTIVGNGSENWLNGKEWQTNAFENKMSIVNSAYSITFKGLKYNPDGYKFNFAVNSSSEYLFGCSYTETHGNLTIGNLSLDEKPLTFNIPKEYEAADVTIYFNFGGYDSTDKTGATFAINIIEAEKDLPKNLRLVGNGTGNWLNGKSYNYTGTSNMLEEKNGVYSITYKNIKNNNDVLKYYFMNGSTFFDAQGILCEAPLTVTIPEEYYSADIVISLDLRNYNPTTKTGAKNSVSLANKISFGDANLDNTLSVEDVTAMQMYISKTNTFTNDQYNISDVNSDFIVDINDATYLQLYLAKQIDKLK